MTRMTEPSTGRSSTGVLIVEVKPQFAGSDSLSPSIVPIAERRSRVGRIDPDRDRSIEGDVMDLAFTTISYGDRRRSCGVQLGHADDLAHDRTRREWIHVRLEPRGEVSKKR